MRSEAQDQRLAEAKPVARYNREGEGGDGGMNLGDARSSQNMAGTSIL